jgi:hypothetical protein
MNADILAILTDYTTYKSRWILAAIFPDIHHPLIATCVLLTRFNNPGYNIIDQEYKRKYIYTYSNIFSDMIKYKYKQYIEIFYDDEYHYHRDNIALDYFHEYNIAIIVIMIDISDNKAINIDIFRDGDNIAIDIHTYSIINECQRNQISYNTYPITDNMRCIFAQLNRWTKK